MLPYGRPATNLACALAIAALSTSAATQPGAASAVPVEREELMRELCPPPATNEARRARVAELLVQAGAPAGATRFQALPQSSDANVYFVRPGRTLRAIVVGAHFDKTAVGDGAVDDWTGIVAMTNLLQALRGLELKHTIVFVGFDAEEKGLVGSKRFVEQLAELKLDAVDAMLNLECLGIGPPQIWKDGTHPDLEASALEIAKASSLPLTSRSLRGVSADSEPFRLAGIPSITIDGLPTSAFGVLHSPQDTCAAVQPEHFEAAYRLAIRLLVEWDRR